MQKIIKNDCFRDTVSKSFIFTLFAVVVFSFFVSPLELRALPTDSDVAGQCSEPPEDSLVPCGFDLNGDGSVKNTGDCIEECNFNHLIIGIKNITDLLIILAVALAALIFAWAGFLYVTAAGSPGQIEKAHKIFGKVFIGLVLILSAWLIVYFIQTALIDDDSFKNIDEIGDL
ncbi:MAG: hypothetical protein COV70_00325 [Parcubacteria group bacterium CG11_big_fil_rev_8_21_14_0_20_39_22]|nr:MAG: hypothetical protein COV70_00325 [Parcubacteria group bacterium CG11_big_fil_rev_8_21_14_0_20_39_22]